MQITRDQLLDSDYQHMLNRDPESFFEAILITILWDKTPANIDYELIARQKFVFMRWLSMYANDQREQAAAKTRSDMAYELTRQYNNGEVAGRIQALSQLPIKKTGLHKSVDLVKVTALLNQLKALSPEGASNDKSPTNQLAEQGVPLAPGTGARFFAPDGSER